MIGRRIIYLAVMLFSFYWVGAQNNGNVDIRKPIALDARALSGLDLKRVTNKDDPDRILHQKKLLWGENLGIFVVSSETKSVHWDSYGIEEFIYVINGRARLNPDDGEEVFFNPGDFFMAPLGYQGEWETQGGREFYYELSVIATDRSNTKVDETQIKPFTPTSEDLSGVNLPDSISVDGYSKVIYEGVQLSVELCAENPIEKAVMKTQEDELIYVIGGNIELVDSEQGEHTFYAGDFFLLPKGFMGNWKSEGHNLFRYMKITSSAVL